MISILKTSLHNLLGIKSDHSNMHQFQDIVSPIRHNIYEEIRYATETMHNIMLKTAKFVKVNDSLLPLTGISYDDIQLISGTPTNPLLGLSGSIRYGVDKYGQIRIIDYRSGNLMKSIDIARINNNYCTQKSLRSSCLSPESLLQNWLLLVVTGYRKYMLIRNCALITNDRKEHKYLMSICKKIGLNIVCTDLKNTNLQSNSMYHDNDKIDIVIRTVPFHKMINDPSTMHNLLDAMFHKNLIMVNPVEEFIANSRSLQAIIWHMHEMEQFYTSDEHKFIREYMLPTYIVPRMDGPTWLMQYFGEEEARFENFDEIPIEVMEEDGIIYQYRGDADYVYELESHLIGNKFAGCVYTSNNNYEYTFVKTK